MATVRRKVFYLKDLDDETREKYINDWLDRNHIHDITRVKPFEDFYRDDNGNERQRTIIYYEKS